MSSLPDDIRPGPDLYGVPWEPVMFSSLVGLVTVLLFSCRCYNSVSTLTYTHTLLADMVHKKAIKLLFFSPFINPMS